MVTAISVSDLSVSGAGNQPLLHRIGFDIAQGERVGLIGESGSGKSLTAAALCGLLRPPLHLSGGRIAVNGQDLARATPRQWRCVRGAGIFQIFQSPASALSPARRIGPQLDECLRLEGGNARDRDAALDRVCLPRSVVSQFPYQLSGG